MQYKNLFLLLLALNLTQAYAPANKQTPFHSDSRLFPEEGTVHAINFFYEQVASVASLPKPETGWTFSFTSMEDLYQLSLFEEEHSHAFAFKSPLFYIFDSISPTVTKLAASTETSTNVALTFQHSNPQKSTVALIKFTKANKKITANITLYGLDNQPQNTFVHLLKALMLGDKFVKKHAGKIMLGTGVGLACIYKARRYQNYKAHCIDWQTSVDAIEAKVKTVPGWKSTTKNNYTSKGPYYSTNAGVNYYSLSNDSGSAKVFIVPLNIFKIYDWTTTIYIQDSDTTLKQSSSDKIQPMIIFIDVDGILNSNKKLTITSSTFPVLLHYKKESAERTMVLKPTPGEITCKIESFDEFLTRIGDCVQKLGKQGPS